MPDHLEIITSTKNPKLVHIKNLLSDKKYRDEHNEFVVEGNKFIQEISDKDISYIASSDPGSLKEAFRNISFNVQQNIINKISGTESAQNMIAVVKKPVYSTKDITPGRWVIAEGIQDPGNLGTIIRTIEASGAIGLIYTEGTVDPFSPKVVRASAGSVLHIPLVKVETVAAVKKAVPTMKLVATVITGGTTYTEMKFEPFCAIVMGSEGQGLSEQTLRLVDTKVSIPLAGKTESLNVAITAGVLLFQK